MKYEVFVPILPPGINATYGYTKNRVYKKPVAVQWENDAALIIGSKAAELDWKDSSKFYEIIIHFNNWRQDADAPVKLIIDTLTRKLGFNDSRILKQSSLKVRFGEPGVIIKLLPMKEVIESES